MAEKEEINRARNAIEIAIQDYVRLSRGDETIYIADWVLCSAGESMKPGGGNSTLITTVNRSNMALYVIEGLIDTMKHYYKKLR